MTEGLEMVGYVVGGVIGSIFIADKLMGRFFPKNKGNGRQLDRLVKLSEDQLIVMQDIRTSLAVQYEQNKSIQRQLDKLCKEV
jgi:hypothetical protein